MKSNIRRYLFWILDFFNGNPILRNLNEIKVINNTKDDFIVKNYQNKKINELLEYTVRYVPYYKDINEINLNSFPVVNKAEYKKDINNFCSSEFKKKQLYKSITSGSTGTPFVSFQNTKKKRRNTADVLYFAKLAGYNLGEPLFYLKIWSENNRKSKLIQFLQNIISVDVIKLSDFDIKELIDNIKSRKGIAHINSYSSTLEELCKYLEKRNNSNLDSISKIQVKSIIAQSEAITKETKEELNRYFKCMTCSRYSNLENGIIAQQTLKDNNIFLINRASYKIEVLKMDSDKPADTNELGRIVITDLFNYAMPFIRYDTGDIGKFLVNPDGSLNFNYLEELQGRKLDLLLDTEGNIVSSYIMYKNMFNYPEIDQFQLIQEDKKRYRFIISISSRFERENELKNEFLRYLGSDAYFKIEYVNEIPLLSSGKRRKIVNNYLKNQKI